MAATPRSSRSGRTAGCARSSLPSSRAVVVGVMAAALLSALTASAPARAATAPDSGSAAGGFAPLALRESAGSRQPLTLGISVVPSSTEEQAKGHRLPFAGNPAPKSYPRVFVGFGLGAYASEYRGVMNAFGAVEDSIRARGYAIPNAGDVSPGAAYQYSFGVNITPVLDATLQYDIAKSGGDELQFLGGLVSGRFLIPGSEVSLLGGAGAGVYTFSFERQYDVPISAVDPSGGYTSLDYVRFDGGGNYWSLAGGAAIRLLESGEIEGRVQYFGARDVTAQAGSGQVALNVSGAMFSASLKYVF